MTDKTLDEKAEEVRRLFEKTHMTYFPDAGESIETAVANAITVAGYSNSNKPIALLYGNKLLEITPESDPQELVKLYNDSLKPRTSWTDNSRGPRGGFTKDI